MGFEVAAAITAAAIAGGANAGAGTVIKALPSVRVFACDHHDVAIVLLCDWDAGAELPGEQALGAHVVVYQDAAECAFWGTIGERFVQQIAIEEDDASCGDFDGDGIDGFIVWKVV